MNRKMKSTEKSSYSRSRSASMKDGRTRRALNVDTSTPIAYRHATGNSHTFESTIHESSSTGIATQGDNSDIMLGVPGSNSFHNDPSQGYFNSGYSPQTPQEGMLDSTTASVINAQSLSTPAQSPCIHVSQHGQHFNGQRNGYSPSFNGNNESQYTGWASTQAGGPTATSFFTPSLPAHAYLGSPESSLPEETLSYNGEVSPLAEKCAQQTFYTTGNTLFTKFDHQGTALTEEIPASRLDLPPFTLQVSQYSSASGANFQNWTLPDSFENTGVHSPISPGGSLYDKGFLHPEGQSPQSACPSSSYASSEADSTVSNYDSNVGTSLVSAEVPLDDPMYWPSEQPPVLENSQSTVGKRPKSPRPRSSRNGESSRKSSERHIYPKKPRGRRTKPLRTEQRISTKKIRDSRTVCHNCKLKRVKCPERESKNSLECLPCLKKKKKAKTKESGPWVCFESYFSKYVEKASIAILAQKTVCHLASHQIHYRRLVELPEEFNMASLASTLNELRENYNIYVYQGQKLLCMLHLDACYEYITTAYQHTIRPFGEFIDKLEGKKTDTWKRCIYDSQGQLLRDDMLGAAYLAWEHMPSYVTYALAQKGQQSPDNFLEAESESDCRFIIAATQMFRILARMLELAFYKHLENVLVPSDKGPTIEVTKQVVREAGHAAMYLRQKVVWLNKVGMSLPQPPDQHGDAAATLPAEQVDSERISRLTSLTKSLYFHACYQARLLNLSGDEDMKSETIRYPDGFRAIKETFPSVESLSGFENWMDEGVRNLAGAIGIEVS